MTLQISDDTFEPQTDAAKCARWLSRMSGGLTLDALRAGRRVVPFSRLERSHRLHCAALGWTPLSRPRLSRALRQLGIVRRKRGAYCMGWRLPASVADWLAVCSDTFPR